MGFQSTVRLDQTDGIVGEVIFGGPLRAEPKTLNSTSAANNVIGRVFQQVAGANNDNEVSSDVGSAAVFAGILSNPKEHATSGPATGTLDPTLTLPNNTEGSLVKEGTMIVELTSASNNIGNEVYYNHTNGTLSSVAPGAGAPANSTRVPNGTVVRQNIPTANTLAYIHFNG